MFAVRIAPLASSFSKVVCVHSFTPMSEGLKRKMMIPAKVMKIRSQMKSAAGGPLGACLSRNGFLGLLLSLIFILL